MSAEDTFAVLALMLKRKVTRLESLQKGLQAHTQVAQFHDNAQLLAQLRDLSSDVCQLTIVLFAMRRPETSGLSSKIDAVNLNEIDAILRNTSNHSGSLYYGHERIINDAVEFARGMKAADFDPWGMQRELDKLQAAVAKLEDVTDAAQPGGLLSILLRVGLVTLAAAGVAAPIAALVLNDPISKKILEAALTTFIATATVEAATASKKYFLAFGEDTSVDCGGRSEDRRHIGQREDREIDMDNHDDYEL